jgi:hypothetical protein
MRSILLTSALIALAPLPLNAQDVAPSSELATSISNVALGIENGNGEDVAKSEVVSATLGVANSELDKVEDDILSASNFTHMELTLGSDSLGVSGTKTKSEVMAVYRLKETDNWFMFNQSSAVNYNNRTTVNTGFGARYINVDETIIFGANAFYDYELQSKHKRNGVGIELLSSIFEFRANQYNAVSAALLYEGVTETAMDGNDFKLTANLPYLYSSNVYYSKGSWKAGTSSTIDTKEFGFEAEILPNLILGVAQQKQDQNASQTVASLSYSFPLGGAKQPAKTMQDGSWSTKLSPIKEVLYKPVERESRIMKAVGSSGSGGVFFGTY